MTVKTDIGAIIKEAFDITKRNKKLWVFGIVIAMLSSGGSFGNFGNSSSYNDQKQTQTTNYDPNATVQNNGALNTEDGLTQEDIDDAVGMPLNSGTNYQAQVFQQIESWFANFDYIGFLTKYWLYLTLGFVMLLMLIAVGMAIRYYGLSWAESALIKGIHTESLKEQASLYQLSDFAKTKAIEVIKIKLIPGLILFLVFVSMMGFTVSLLVALPEALRWIAIIFMVALILAWIFAVIAVGIAANLGIFAITLENLTWKPAFRRGVAVFKKFFVDIVVLGLVNCLFGCIIATVSIILIVILGGIGLAGILGIVAVPALIIVAAPVILLALVAFVLIAGLISAGYMVFKKSTWVLLYKQIMDYGKESNGTQQ